MRVSSLLLLVGATGALAYLAGNTIPALSGWRSTDGTLKPGRTYRVSYDDPGNVDAESVAKLFASIGGVGVQVWTPSDDPPSDWPSDDRGPGRFRVEFKYGRTVTGQLAPIGNVKVYEHT